jgi:GT2 family glycosyltransferase
METRAPAVVAVVVTTGPSPTLLATLASLAAQDYDQFSVLVLENGDAAATESVVAASSPSAFLRVLDRNDGFAAACNEAAAMVEGAAFLCFCHDDVELAPDAIHQLVEEAYRSNAGVVTPKFVRPEDHSILLHVGLNADRFGATTERVEPGEVDQGQHDTARDVFVAPGGVTLVRADLFETLGGFDGDIVVLGEDLDLCWRAQVAGSRVVVAHLAVVAHHELLANGARPLTANVSGYGSRSLQSLSRRHRLSTMLSCYGWLQVVPMALLLAGLEAGEIGISLVGRDRDRVSSVLGSWRWCLGRFGTIWQRRRRLSKIRTLDDHDVRRLQVAGASRLRTFATRLVHEGMDAARGVLAPVMVVDTAAPVDEPLDHTVGFGAAFSDDSSFDELDDLGHRTRVVHHRIFSTPLSQLVLVTVVLVVFLFGVRNLVGSSLPIVGRLVPLDSWWTTWRHFFATWSSTGVGSGAPGQPGYGVLGVAGTFVFGRMGVLPRAALILTIPLGAIGIWRLLKSVGSSRARLIGAVAFVCGALGANLVAGGRVDVLPALAVMPFLVRRLLVIAGVQPFAERPPRGHASPLDVAWRSSRTGQLVIAAALEAVISALDPAAGIAVIVAAIGLFAGGLVVGDRRPGRVLGAALWSSALTAILLLPLTIDTLVAGTTGLDVFGSPSGPWNLPGLGGMVRLAVGPFGTGPLGWLLPGAAVFALLVARAERLSAAARFAGMGAASLAASLLVARHLTGSFTPDVTTLLVPFAIAVPALIGTGVAAFEVDVAASRFGWRQLLAGLAVLAILVGGPVPFVAASATGRFDLPLHGFDTQIGALPTHKLGGSRTLWLGDPRALPLAGWTIEPGLAYATSTTGLPSGDDLFSPPGSGAAHVIADDLVIALRGGTVHLGRLLAAAGISDVVVVTSTAPALAGSQQPIELPPPTALEPALLHQRDLQQEQGNGGALVFVNKSSHGIISTRPQPLEQSASPGTLAGSRFWLPALRSSTWAGRLPAGVLLAALAPAGDFTATVDGKSLSRSSAYGWAASWTAPSGIAAISLDAPPLNAVLAGVVLALWLLVVAAIIGLDRLGRLVARLRRRTAPPDVLDAAPEDMT